MEKKCKVEGVPLAYFQAGSEENEDLLLIPGYLALKEIFLETMRELISDFRVTLLDLPGLGNSGDLQPWTLPKCTEIVSRFIQETNLKKPHLVGHSLGGTVLLKMAAQNEDNLGKLVLVDSVGFLKDKNLWFLGLKRLFEVLNPLDFNDTIIKAFFKNLLRHRLKIFNLLGPLFELDVSEECQKIKLPTLIIWGEKDRFVPEDQGEKFQTKIPGAQLVTIPGANHDGFYRKPKQFVREIVDFLKKESLQKAEVNL